jgi:nucleoid-associated protein YgaU
MIFKGSRYSGTPVISPARIDGSTPQVLAQRVIPPAPGVVSYTVVEGERLDQLAYRYYSEAQKYWLLLDANPDVLDPFELLQPGRVIQIPQNRIVS